MEQSLCYLVNKFPLLIMDTLIYYGEQSATGCAHTVLEEDWQIESFNLFCILSKLFPIHILRNF